MEFAIVFELAVLIFAAFSIVSHISTLIEKAESAMREMDRLKNELENVKFAVMDLKPGTPFRAHRDD